MAEKEFYSKYSKVVLPMLSIDICIPLDWYSTILIELLFFFEVLNVAASSTSYWAVTTVMVHGYWQGKSKCVK